MPDYIKTIINGLKAWVTSEVKSAAENSISETRVNELIDEKLGVIENGSY